MPANLPVNPTHKELVIKEILEKGPVPLQELLDQVGIKMGYAQQLFTMMRKHGIGIIMRNRIVQLSKEPNTLSTSKYLERFPAPYKTKAPVNQMTDAMVDQRILALKTAINLRGVESLPKTLSALDELLVKVLTA